MSTDNFLQASFLNSILLSIFQSALNTLWERERSGAGSGSIPLTSGSGSGRPKNMRIRIPNTATDRKDIGKRKIPHPPLPSRYFSGGRILRQTAMN